MQKGWTVEKWQEVDFFDESSIELHPNCRKYCRRPVGTRMEPRFTQKTVKFGGGKIMVWGYIQFGGVCDRSAEWMATSTTLSIKEFLLIIRFQTTREGKFLSRIALLLILKPPSKFLKAKKVKVLQDWPA